MEELKRLFEFLDSDDPEIVCLYLNIIKNEYENDLIKRFIQINKLSSPDDNTFFIKKRFYFYKVEEEWKLLDLR